MPVLDLSPDELLTTTRSVRRRLDFSRPVEPEVIMQCLKIAYPDGLNFTPATREPLQSKLHWNGW